MRELQSSITDCYFVEIKGFIAIPNLEQAIRPVLYHSGIPVL